MSDPIVRHELDTPTEQRERQEKRFEGERFARETAKLKADNAALREALRLYERSHYVLNSQHVGRKEDAWVTDKTATYTIGSQIECVCPLCEKARSLLSMG